MAENKSFIKLNRALFENFLWKEKREFSKLEAWVDLIQSARFEATTEVINGKIIELKRGEVPASRRFLELRWNWGSSKVTNFIKTLTQLSMVNQRQANGQTVISLVKYSVYNDDKTKNKPRILPIANQEHTNDEPEANQNKEYKELKEQKELKNIYRSFAHLSISVTDFNKLNEKYSKEDIDDILDAIENSSSNKKYTSLYLTANTWLKRRQADKTQSNKPGPNALTIF